MADISLVKTTYISTLMPVLKTQSLLIPMRVIVLMSSKTAFVIDGKNSRYMDRQSHRFVGGETMRLSAVAYDCGTADPAKADKNHCRERRLS